MHSGRVHAGEKKILLSLRHLVRFLCLFVPITKFQSLSSPLATPPRRERRALSLCLGWLLPVWNLSCRATLNEKTHSSPTAPTFFFCRGGSVAAAEARGQKQIWKLGMCVKMWESRIPRRENLTHSLSRRKLFFLFSAHPCTYSCLTQWKWWMMWMKLSYSLQTLTSPTSPPAGIGGGSLAF